MQGRFSKLIMAAGAAATLTAGSLIPRPASADTTSTLLTAAAVIGGIVLYNNYEHKKAEANTIVGYTANGGTVYADGRVVMPNGQTYYQNGGGYNYPVPNAYNGPAYGYGNGHSYPNQYGYNTTYNHGGHNGRWQDRNGTWHDANDNRGRDWRDHR
ncbi:MAG: hypothetical protein JO164_09910 [Candidatus Eremiobacteraeota bacterium]|nr:hypothetical protein [Candidatus Eremiobacteraeota bacterium]